MSDVQEPVLGSTASAEEGASTEEDISEKRKEKMRAYHREWRKKNPEKSRASQERYRQNRHDRRLATYKKYRGTENGKLKHRKQAVSWYQRNIGKMRIAAREKYHKDKAKGQRLSREFYHRHRARIRPKVKLKLQEQRMEIYNAYGGPICKCCGKDDLRFLTVDHINNDGGKHRREIGRGHYKFYIWLRDRGFPPGFQILCMECNWAKARIGSCPHSELKTPIDIFLKTSYIAAFPESRIKL